MRSEEEIKEKFNKNKKILKINSNKSNINMKQLKALKENFILEWVLDSSK